MSKYRNVKTLAFGMVFDSKREAMRYITLRALQDEGKIRELRRQVKYPCEINGVKVCEYFADFTYTTCDGTFVAEDAKGVKTAVYQLKKKLIRALYGIVIKET